MEVATKTKEGKKKVMIIDDNEIDIFINQKVLEFNNFASEIINIQAAQNAIDQLKSSKIEDIPNLIFLDLNMPIMDGFRFLYEFSLLPDEVRAKIKIVVLTSSDNSNDKEKVAANADVLTYISKPLTDQKLSEIASMLD
ncbi:response regulator [Fulvivirga sp.]|jgi:CheY-like chemotaxis protein|uniref:response regulator n=1 Tax=Fulvivirga sp. TaxID=1931237 RepID=UPI0032EFBEA6